jgi:hypothetical protein
MTDKRNVLKTAAKYLRWGWPILPLPAGEKRCLITGWKNLHLKEADLPEYFDDDSNIGVRLDGDLTDVDNDCAEALWIKRYHKLSAESPGFVGAITARAEAQALRLAMIYALLDQSRVIKTQHLHAALAVWRYCRDSVRYIFGKSLGYPLADRILQKLRSRPNGMTRLEITNLFNRNVSGPDMSAALDFLQTRNLAWWRKEAAEQGRPTERWFAGRKQKV